MPLTATAPIGGKEMDLSTFNPSMLEAIKTVLTERGETRPICKLWRLAANASYYVAFETPIGQAPNYQMVSDIKLVEVWGQQTRTQQ